MTTSVNIVLLTWNATSSKFKCYYIFPGFYPSTATKVEAAVVKDEAVVPATAGLTTQSVVRVSAEKNLVYYSAGNSCLLTTHCLVVISHKAH